MLNLNQIYKIQICLALAGLQLILFYPSVGEALHLTGTFKTNDFFKFITRLRKKKKFNKKLTK